MTVDQMTGLGLALSEFLDEFTDSFGRCELRGKLSKYVRGQLSELPRKSAEPMALAAGITPRTLQEFLASDDWDQDRLRWHTQRVIVRDHADEQAIGVIDESGHPKKGSHTACVSRQYCGRTGKIDNCVMTVHLTFTSFDTRFRTMIDSDLYLPQAWHEDRERCRQAKIPDEVVYRPKYTIALEQLDRASQRHPLGMVDGGRVVRSEAGVRVRSGNTRPTICAGNPAELCDVAARSAALRRGGQAGGDPAETLESTADSTVASVPRQRHGQRSDGLGSESRRVLAAARRRGWSARTG